TLFEKKLKSASATIITFLLMNGFVIIVGFCLLVI
ncbi:MAG: hypothetical protein ACI8RP_001431, partial [Urechidicola sp.]